MVIAKSLYKELEKINKQEEKWLSAKAREHVVKDRIYEKVPDGLSHTLELAFEKAFSLVFQKGRGILEKTFDKETLQLEFAVGNQYVEQKQTKKSMKLLGKQQKRNNFMNHASTTVTGFGLGLLGLGLPDIPLFVSTILKGIYEVALSYGFSYEAEEEQIYILRLIRTALSTGGERRIQFQNLTTSVHSEIHLEEEIKETAKALSDALLVEKFVQGIPVVGMVGGFVNHAVYKKILFLGKLEYKKRYILSKGAEYI